MEILSRLKLLSCHRCARGRINDLVRDGNAGAKVTGGRKGSTCVLIQLVHQYLCQMLRVPEVDRMSPTYPKLPKTRLSRLTENRDYPACTLFNGAKPL